mgnify:CR=1 FL=1
MKHTAYGTKMNPIPLYINSMKNYIEKNILPLYEKNDSGHGIEHIRYVTERCLDFAEQFEGLLRFTFELDDTLEIVGEDNTDEKRLLFTCIVAAVQKVYLEKCLEAIAAEDN